MHKLESQASQLILKAEGYGESRLDIDISVQAENENFSDPTFLKAFDLNFHMPGHFLLYEVVYAYPSGPLAFWHKK